MTHNTLAAKRRLPELIEHLQHAAEYGSEVEWEDARDAADLLESLLADLTAANARVKEADAENAKLVADLAKFDAEISCEGCGAPLFDGDDFVTGPEDGCSGCWAAMTDLPSKRERPCYAYRVGKPSAIADREGRSDG